MRDGLLFSLATSAIPLILRSWIPTWSVGFVNAPVLRHYIWGRRPMVGVLWHQATIVASAVFRDTRAVIMVSRSRDGEIISRVINRLGMRAVRGSSTTGGQEALSELVREVRDGAIAGITVDGPRGPARVPKMGCVIAARDTGAPVIPVACAATGIAHARSWDRTIIPLPFARISIAFGEPFRIPPDADVDECERWRLRVGVDLNHTEQEARRRL